VAEGYRTLREVGALDRVKAPHRIRPPERADCLFDPRLGRMLIEARKEHCLAEVLPIVAALESSDPRERPAEKTREAMRRMPSGRSGESDFIFTAPVVAGSRPFPRRTGGGGNAMPWRKFCGPAFSQRPPRDGMGERPPT
jgi:ATP-dependent helicase HrpA